MADISKSTRQSEMKRYKEAVKEEQFRSDGYRNMLNKVGTMQDNSQAWEFTDSSYATDMELIRLYETNGLFAKIVDRPAEDAMSKGLDLSDLGEELENMVNRKLQTLGWSEIAITAEKWSRLFGGAIGVLLVDDGRGIDEPLDFEKVKKLEEIRVFERAIVQPDYSTLFSYSYLDMGLDEERPWGQPIYYNVYSVYGQFKVHYSRCLIFKNGKQPEFIANGLYRFWGIPIYSKIRDALRETITAHHDGTRLLERSVLGIYKMKNLSTLLGSDEGEDKVIQRLQIIDMARHIINSMAIDSDGEDYQYINASMAGAKDLIDATCNMLSAVTDIPQTILFGRSPAGEDATGDNDTESYYQMLGRIQANNLQRNTETVIKLVLNELAYEGKIKDELPEYEVRFVPFKQMTEQEEAEIESIKAATEQVKAATAQVYVDMQALDPTEVRKGLMEADAYEIQSLIDESDPLELPEDTLPEMEGEEQQPESENAVDLKQANGIIEAGKRGDNSRADFDEDLHPRGKDGRFTTKSVSAEGSSESGKGAVGEVKSGKNGNFRPKHDGARAIDTKDALAESKGDPKEGTEPKKNSLTDFMDEDGNLSPERQAVHDEIIQEFFADKVAFDGQPTMIMSGGGPA